MKRIFISRELKPSSSIIQTCKNEIIVDQSLILFSPLKFEAPKADWVFFYSRNGVKFFFEGGNYALFPYLWACMSHGTADELSNYVTDVSFVGGGSPSDVARSFETMRKPDDTVCFVRAQNSLDSVHKMIRNENDFSIPVYNNAAIQNPPQESFDILVFTSPMNVDVWFKNREYSDEQVIAIGNTTSDQLKSFGIKDVIVTDIPSEQSISKSIEKLL